MSDLDQHVVPELDNTHALEVAPLSWLPGAELPAELHTGFKVIDFEHEQLLGCMHSLRRLCRDFVVQKDCTSCESAIRQSCEKHLIGMLGDLLAFVLEHFKNEEAIMRQSMLLDVNREVCQAHMEDHADISAKIQEIIMALKPMNTVVLLRELDVLLQRWIANHVMLHDLVLSRWLDSQGQALSFSKSF
jgi:hemerythrin-like metal-binding protein